MDGFEKELSGILPKPAGLTADPVGAMEPPTKDPLGLGALLEFCKWEFRALGLKLLLLTRRRLDSVVLVATFKLNRCGLISI